MENLLREPNWIVAAIIGAIFGVTIQNSFMAIQAVRKRFKTSYLEGTWYGYHTTYFSNEAIVQSTVWRVKKGFLYSFILVCEDRVHGLTYKGTISLSNESILVKITTNRSNTIVDIRLEHRFLTNATKIPGLWLSVDHDRVIASGSLILLREELSIEEVSSLLNATIKSERRLPLLRLKK